MKLSSAQLLSLMLATAIVVSLSNCKHLYSNRDTVQFKEVQQISSTLPVFPGFQDTGSTRSYAKPMVVSVHKTYRSNARFDDVKTFYGAHLTQAGWQLTTDRALKDGWDQDVGGRELRFKRGQYSVGVEYIGDKAVEPDWNYAISVAWDQK